MATSPTLATVAAPGGRPSPVGHRRARGRDHGVGSWGVGVYENDDGADWASEIQAGGLDAVEGALAAADGADYLDGFEASGALVAADVVARLLRGGGAQTSDAEPVVLWMEDNLGLAVDHLVDPALRVLDRIASPVENELYEEWAASGELAAWLAVVDEVRSRLTSMDAAPGPAAD